MPARLDRNQFDTFLDSRPGWIVLTSIGADGYPHSVPLGYFRDGDSVFCGVRDGTRKVRNIEANPKVSLLVESGRTMADLKGAMIQGDARIHRDPEQVLALMRLAATQRGAAPDELPREARPGAVYIEIRPVRRISWDYGR
jgi:nitroimidazol reductase NimA-like FMN-containing flavoprotein (pyridoxamine 5'-phosphate oxidase superfamily)